MDNNAAYLTKVPAVTLIFWIMKIAATTLEGRCPPLLKDFLEVRGLGLINIRAIYGETAVRPKMKLKLVAHLEKPSSNRSEIVERLPLSELSEDVLGVTIRKVLIPVAAGRNLAVLLEAAVRAYEGPTPLAWANAFRLPAAGRLVRNAYPFATFAESEGQLRLAGISRELVELAAWYLSVQPAARQ